jgi:hypothetical protein
VAFQRRCPCLFAEGAANDMDPVVIVKSCFDLLQILRVRFKTPGVCSSGANLQKLSRGGTVVPTDIGKDFTILTQFKEILKILLCLPIGETLQGGYVGVQAELDQSIQHLHRQ